MAKATETAKSTRITARSLMLDPLTGEAIENNLRYSSLLDIIRKANDTKFYEHQGGKQIIELHFSDKENVNKLLVEIEKKFYINGKWIFGGKPEQSKGNPYMVKLYVSMFNETTGLSKFTYNFDLVREVNELLSIKSFEINKYELNSIINYTPESNDSITQILTAHGILAKLDATNQTYENKIKEYNKLKELPENAKTFAIANRDFHWENHIQEFKNFTNNLSRAHATIQKRIDNLLSDTDKNILAIKEYLENSSAGISKLSHNLNNPEEVIEHTQSELASLIPFNSELPLLAKEQALSRTSMAQHIETTLNNLHKLLPVTENQPSQKEQIEQQMATLKGYKAQLENDISKLEMDIKANQDIIKNRGNQKIAILAKVGGLFSDVHNTLNDAKKTHDNISIISANILAYKKNEISLTKDQLESYRINLKKFISQSTQQILSFKEAQNNLNKLLENQLFSPNEKKHFSELLKKHTEDFFKSSKIDEYNNLLSQIDKLINEKNLINQKNLLFTNISAKLERLISNLSLNEELIKQHASLVNDNSNQSSEFDELTNKINENLKSLSYEASNIEHDFTKTMHALLGNNNDFPDPITRQHSEIIELIHSAKNTIISQENIFHENIFADQNSQFINNKQQKIESSIIDFSSAKNQIQSEDPSPDQTASNARLIKNAPDIQQEIKESIEQINESFKKMGGAKIFERHDQKQEELIEKKAGSNNLQNEGVNRADGQHNASTDQNVFDISHDGTVEGNDMDEENYSDPSTNNVTGTKISKDDDKSNSPANASEFADSNISPSNINSQPKNEDQDHITDSGSVNGQELTDNEEDENDILARANNNIQEEDDDLEIQLSEEQTYQDNSSTTFSDADDQEASNNATDSENNTSQDEDKDSPNHEHTIDEDFSDTTGNAFSEEDDDEASSSEAESIDLSNEDQNEETDNSSATVEKEPEPLDSLYDKKKKRQIIDEDESSEVEDTEANKNKNLNKEKKERKINETTEQILQIRRKPSPNNSRMIQNYYSYSMKGNYSPDFFAGIRATSHRPRTEEAFLPLAPGIERLYVSYTGTDFRVTTNAIKTTEDLICKKDESPEAFETRIVETAFAMVAQAYTLGWNQFELKGSPMMVAAAYHYAKHLGIEDAKISIQITGQGAAAAQSIKNTQPSKTLGELLASPLFSSDRAQLQSDRNTYKTYSTPKPK